MRNNLTSACSDAASQRMTSVSHSPLSLEGVGAQKNEKRCFCSLCEVSTGLGELQGGSGCEGYWLEQYKGLVENTAGSCCVSR